MPTSHSMPADAPDLDAIYDKLTHGLGHELVNDDNVFALIDRADRDGHTVLATELREWQSPCGGAPEDAGGS